WGFPTEHRALNRTAAARALGCIGDCPWLTGDALDASLLDRAAKRDSSRYFVASRPNLRRKSAWHARLFAALGLNRAPASNSLRASVMSRLLPHFGPYEAVRRLGAGGMAETFVAVRRGPGGFEQKVCIKRILPAYADDRAFVESFLREARTSAALHHTNIVQVLDFGVADESYYLALELIDGLDLRALLVDEAEGGTGALPPEVVALIAGELSTALEHAHAGDVERGPIVHRDLSPSN